VAARYLTHDSVPTIYEKPRLPSFRAELAALSETGMRGLSRFFQALLVTLASLREEFVWTDPDLPSKDTLSASAASQVKQSVWLAFLLGEVTTCDLSSNWVAQTAEHLLHYVSCSASPSKQDSLTSLGVK
jgi:hypothetical protein